MSSVIVRNNVFPVQPAAGTGAVKLFADMTGCSGILANNYFGALVDPALSEVQFAAAGTAAKIPATVFLAGNWGEVKSTGNTSNTASIGRYA